MLVLSRSPPPALALAGLWALGAEGPVRMLLCCFSPPHSSLLRQRMLLAPGKADADLVGEAEPLFQTRETVLEGGASGVGSWLVRDALWDACIPHLRARAQVPSCLRPSLLLIHTLLGTLPPTWGIRLRPAQPQLVRVCFLGWAMTRPVAVRGACLVS